MPRAKELKVRIPIKHHLRLHTLKLTEGITITEAVETALRDYFARADAQEPEGERESASSGELG